MAALVTIYFALSLNMLSKILLYGVNLHKEIMLTLQITLISQKNFNAEKQLITMKLNGSHGNQRRITFHISGTKAIRLMTKNESVQQSYPTLLELQP